MGKLQPNFSWQKYEGRPEDQKEQFQYQLQQEHIVVANSVNATIDDESYFTKERQTSFTWINGRPIFTKTFTMTLAILGNNTINHNIIGIAQVVGLHGIVQNAIPLSTLALPLPYSDTTSLANQIALFTSPTQITIALNASSPWQNYLAQVTIEYTKD